METLNGDFDEYINNADEDGIKHIAYCCNMFRKLEYKTTNSGRKYELMLLNPTKREFEKVRDPDV